MPYLKSFCRKYITTFIYALIYWLSVCAVTVAAPPQQKQAEQQQGSYVLPYAIVILTIAVGLMLVCRPTRRRDRAKPEGYDPAKQGAAE